MKIKHSVLTQITVFRVLNDTWLILYAMKTAVKFYISLFALACIIYLIRFKYNSYYNVFTAQSHVLIDEYTELESIKNLKYILIWTLNMDWGEGTKQFEQRQCLFNNCFVTSRRDFRHVTKFNVIIFGNPEVTYEDLPMSRSLHQKYIFASTESSSYYPLCDEFYNGFFNWTWTYKLNSDVVNSYITIKNRDGQIIGPKEIMHWKKIEEMEPIDEVLKNKLNTKKHAVAWFVSNCYTLGERENLASQLMLELQQYDLFLDVYGECGTDNCSKSEMKHCLEMLEKNYFFYLSFENSLSEDYVTEKLLHPLQHYTVPIVFGAANYSRFMPDGIYLDANILSVKELARKMAELIYIKDEYYKYFKWHNHYSYHVVGETPATDSYCKLCEIINNEELFNTTSVYFDFINWWSGRDGSCA